MTLERAVNTGFDPTALAVLSSGETAISFSLGFGGKVYDAQLQSFRSVDLRFPVALGLDGRIIMKGNSTRCLYRLNSDGQIDPTFVAPPLAQGNLDNLSQIAVRSDGKILVGFRVVSGSNPGLFQLNTDGSIDGTFQPANSVIVNAFLVMSDGRIVVAGDGVQRLLADGQVDPSFTKATATGQCGGVAMQSNGKIVLVGGFTQINSTSRPYLARLNQDGTFDPFFAPKGTSTGMAWLKVQSTDAIVTATTKIVRRWLPDGTVDSSFAPPLVGQTIHGLDIDASDRIYFNDGVILYRYSGQYRAVGPSAQIPTVVQSSSAIDSSNAGWTPLKSIPANTEVNYILPPAPTVGNLFYRVQPTP